MFRYFKRHIIWALTALITGIVTQLLTPFSAIMEQRMVDLILSGDMDGFRGTLWVAGAVVLGVALSYFASGVSQKCFEAKFSEGLRNDLYDGIMGRSVVRFEEKDTGEYLSYVTSNASSIAGNLTRPVFYLISYGVSALVVLGIMVYYSPLLAGASLVCGVISMILPLGFNRKLQGLIMTMVEKNAAMEVQLKEALNGHGVISAFGVLPMLRGYFAEANAEVTKTDCKMGVTISELENVGQVMNRVAWFITFLIAGTMTLRGDISVGTLVMFISLFGYFSGSLTIYAQFLPLLLSQKENIQMMIGIIDGGDAEFTGREEPGLEDKIQVCDLSFRYTEDVPVLEHLNLTLRKNEKAVLVGPSGCGKSTLIKLLSGNYAGYTGHIFYDSTELHDIDQRKLRSLVTVIHQNTFIFNDTIRFNICLGEEFPEEDLQRALRLSGVDRFLPSIVDGLDGNCGENGAHLSGGQRQRIALARALIRGVKVLILDEGVSAIDVAAANEIEGELLGMKGLTLLTITHRIRDGLMEQYDRVIVMENGRLQEKQMQSCH
ncbi:MAG: ABC transporter ATP-binding protein/permease [Oscillospiraceae bacterium]|nr:ABC transporter ATP-binding protein/permease [Oscillospiraceae bacterium]